jgi:hypothetical protein
MTAISAALLQWEFWGAKNEIGSRLQEREGRELPVVAKIEEYKSLGLREKLPLLSFVSLVCLSSEWEESFALQCLASPCLHFWKPKVVIATVGGSRFGNWKMERWASVVVGGTQSIKA